MITTPCTRALRAASVYMGSGVLTGKDACKMTTALEMVRGNRLPLELIKFV
jgi:hypothetical protein